MPNQLHRYGCRCPSCNEGTTRAPKPGQQQIDYGAPAAQTRKPKRRPAKQKKEIRK